MRILSAIYLLDKGVKRDVHLREITPRMYENELKGRLYCPTENCPARISFSGGKTTHFRTWRKIEKKGFILLKEQKSLITVMFYAS